jgi:hypothetical protein
MKKYRIWLVDKVEPLGGSWCYGYVGSDNLFREVGFKDEYLDTISQYIKWGYKVEEVQDEQNRRD